jgi:hypothetical protein
MEPLLQRAGVNEKKINYIIKDLDKATEEEINELHSWLSNVKQKEYGLLHHVFKLPENDALWDRYKLLGIEGLPEQEMFNKAAMKLKQVFKTLPKRGKKEEKEEEQD